MISRSACDGCLQIETCGSTVTCPLFTEHSTCDSCGNLYLDDELEWNEGDQLAFCLKCRDISKNYEAKKKLNKFRFISGG